MWVWVLDLAKILTEPRHYYPGTRWNSQNFLFLFWRPHPFVYNWLLVFSCYFGTQSLISNFCPIPNCGLNHELDKLG